MSDDTKPSYTEAAELRTVTGWVCKTCNRFWGNEDERAEHMARSCCAKDVPCFQCGTLNSQRSYCRPCHEKRRDTVWAKMPQRDYDGGVVCVFDDDRYIFGEGELLDYLADLDEEYVDGVRLEHAKEITLHWHRTVSELLGDDCGPEFEWDTSEIDKLIEEWVEKNNPNWYAPANERVSDESLAKLIAEARAAK